MTLKYCHSLILYPYQSHVVDNKDIIYHLQFWVLKCIKDICIQEISLLFQRKKRKISFWFLFMLFLYYCVILFGRDNNSSIISGKKNNRPTRLDNRTKRNHRIRGNDRTRHCRTHHHHYSFMLFY
jgi:hypothetical protein